jgi:acyl carrier protein
MDVQHNDQQLDKLQDIFRQAMGDSVRINLDTRKNMVPEWDSINHLNLIVELESTYQLGLSMEEIEKMDSVKSILERIRDSRN